MIPHFLWPHASSDTCPSSTLNSFGSVDRSTRCLTKSNIVSHSLALSSSLTFSMWQVQGKQATRLWARGQSIHQIRPTCPSSRAAPSLPQGEKLTKNLCYDCPLRYQIGSQTDEQWTRRLLLLRSRHSTALRLSLPRLLSDKPVGSDNLTGSGEGSSGWQ
jgi:hypothetical protein